MTPVVTTPKVQAYIDPVNGGCALTYAISTETNQIIGKTHPLSVNTYQRFYFPTGEAIGAAYDGSADGLTFTPLEACCNFSLPYGKVVFSSQNASSNYVGICWLDPTTDPWTLVGQYGTPGASPDFPLNIPSWFSMTNVATETSNWLLTGDAPFGRVVLISADDNAIETPVFEYTPPDGTGLCGAYLTTGQTGGKLSTVYWLQAPLSTGTFSLLTMSLTDTGPVLDDLGGLVDPVIHTYDPAEFVTNGTLINKFTSFAFDQTDGNLLAYVQVTDDVPVIRQWIVKFDSKTGAIIWQIQLSAGQGANNLAAFSRAVIKNGRFFWFGDYNHSSPVDLYVIDTIAGTATILHPTGLGTALVCEDQASNDVIQGIICEASWDSGAGTIVRLNATPTSGSSLAAVYFIEGSPVLDHIDVCPNPVTTE